MTGSDKLFSAKDIGEYLFGNEISSMAKYIQSRRWFRRKSEQIKKVLIKDYAIINEDPIEIITILEICYEQFHTEIYYLPLMVQSEQSRNTEYETVLQINTAGNTLLLYDAFLDIRFCADLLRLIKQQKQIKSLKGMFTFCSTEVLETSNIPLNNTQIKLISAEQSNTSINYANSFIMKNFRNIEYGVNPDFEITYFLTKQTQLKNVPALFGYIEYQNEDNLIATAAVLQEFITNKGDCWHYTLINLEYVYRIAMRNITINNKDKMMIVLNEFLKDFISEMYKLGEVTGKFHKALTTDDNNSAFKSEVVTENDVDNWLSCMISNIDSVLTKIENNLKNYSDDVSHKLSSILNKKPILIEKVRSLNMLKKIHQRKIRIHGDYHLGQVLKTDDDFVILDFEGEPIKTIEERRAKWLPQKDIAGMLRSFNYAVNASLLDLPAVDPIELENLKSWANVWEELVSKSFLNGYLSFMQSDLPDETIFMETLTAFLIDKAIYELDYEMNNRPTWLMIPVEYLQHQV